MSMKQLRLYIAEEIIFIGFRLMPKGEEKALMAEGLIVYSFEQSKKIAKELDLKRKANR